MFRLIAFGNLRTLLVCSAFLALAIPTRLSAEKYVPPGYSSGQNVEGTGFGLDVGYKKVAEDYYITVTPIVEFGIPFTKLRMGLQLPLELLADDNTPKGDRKKWSVREGTYDDSR